MGTLWKRVAGILSPYNAGYSPDNSLWRDCPLMEFQHDPASGFVWRNDFNTFTTAYDGLSATLTNTGAAAVVASTHGGVLKIECSDGTVADNDEAYVGSTTALIVPSAGRKIWFEASCYFTEANTDDANIIIGLSSTYAANAILDDGGGPPADYYGACFFKVDGGTTWSVECSNSTSQTTNAAIATRTSGATPIRYGVMIEGTDRATFYINSTPVSTIESNLPTAAMGLLFGVKNGYTNEESLYVDWFQLAMMR